MELSYSMIWKVKQKKGGDFNRSPSTNSIDALSATYHTVLYSIVSYRAASVGEEEVIERNNLTSQKKEIYVWKKKNSNKISCLGFSVKKVSHGRVLSWSKHKVDTHK
jgi:hypothetical protein